LRNSIFDNGSTNPLPITGSLNAPTAAGRGTGTITDASGTNTFIYYVVDSKHLRFMVSDGSSIGLGSAEAQTGAPTDASLKGNYVFGTRADDSNSGIQGQNTVGVFTAAGNGTISTGTADSVQDGNSFTQLGLTGTYSVASTGRVTVTLNYSGGLGTVQQVFWLANYGRAYLLTNATTKVEDGTMDLQQALAFSNGSLNGQQAFSMNGIEFTTSGGVIALTRVGWIIWNGQGSLTWNEALNNSSSGFSTTGNLAGTYSVSSNGRAAATVNNLSITSNDIVLYLVTPSQAYMLQNTTGVQIVGSMKGQTSQ
jgi:dipeptidyl aminopeptidase/acylaminoacyl peptidase